MAPEVAAFLRKQPPALGYARLAEACRAAFGAAAPDDEAIRQWWLAHCGPADPRARLSHDLEVAEAVRDLAGRLTIPDIMKKLAETFPPERIPPRSTLYRHVNRLLRPRSRRPAR